MKKYYKKKYENSPSWGNIFNTLLSLIDKICRLQVSKDMDYLNNRLRN